MHAALKAFVVAALVVIIDDVVVHLHVVALFVVNLAGDCLKRESNLRFSPHATHPSNELSQANRGLILPLPPLCPCMYYIYLYTPSPSMAQVQSANRQGLILSGDPYIICGRVPQFIVRMLVSAINLFLFISTYALP